MYTTLLPFHSLIRWLIVAGMSYSLYRACLGVYGDAPFTRRDSWISRWTGHFSHLQLLIGLVLYLKSPTATYFRTAPADAMQYSEYAFFGLYHIVVMVVAIVLVTIGSATAKRGQTDGEKHKKILVWYGIAALLILLAIPWPFHPLAPRPYLRALF
jgi:hypothetical protein